MANMIRTDSHPVNVDPPQPVPAVVMELRAALHDPNLNLDHIVALIASEPALAAEVLRRGNSVMFGSRAPVMDISTAVARIGVNGTYNALVALRA